MKRVFWIIGILLLLPFLMLGFYFLESIYFQAMGSKAEKAALEYLADKYREQFEIDDMEYSKVLGDKEGAYSVKAHPHRQSDISIQLEVGEDYQVLRDNYKESKWENDARNEWLPMVDELFQKAGDTFVHGSFPEEVADRYEISDTYQDILKENPLQSYERIEIVNFEEPFEKEKELNQIYQLWEIMNKREVRSYSMEIKYYPETLRNKLKDSSDSHQFEIDNSKELHFVCRFSKEAVQENPITEPEDITQFCREL